MITQNDIMGCIIFGIIMLLLVILSVILMKGNGAWLIAGYNTLDEKEKAKYDSIALCKFIGRYLLSISLFMPAIPVGWIFEIEWLITVYVAYLLISAIFVIAYCNTGNRFKKQADTREDNKNFIK